MKANGSIWSGGWPWPWCRCCQWALSRKTDYEILLIQNATGNFMAYWMHWNDSTFTSGHLNWIFYPDIWAAVWVSTVCHLIVEFLLQWFPKNTYRIRCCYCTEISYLFTKMCCKHMLILYQSITHFHGRVASVSHNYLLVLVHASYSLKILLEHIKIYGCICASVDWDPIGSSAYSTPGHYLYQCRQFVSWTLNNIFFNVMSWLIEAGWRIYVYAPLNYLNQRWLIVNETLRNKKQCNFNQLFTPRQLINSSNVEFRRNIFPLVNKSRPLCEWLWK